MTTKDKLELMKELERRNNKRWLISTRQQNDRQTAVEYSAREALMEQYIK